MKKAVDVYLCKTDHDFHIPDDKHGIKIFFSEEDIKREMKCVKNCGIQKATLIIEVGENE